MDFEHWRHYARGWLFHFLGCAERAYAAYEQAFRCDPRDARAARHMACIAAEHKRYEVAEHWFVIALEREPDDAATHFNLGFAREQAGKPREAIAAFRAATRLQGSLDRAWYGCGLAHAALGEHAEAIVAFAEATRLQPMNGEAFYQLGMAQHHAGEALALAKTVKQLAQFDPKRAHQLVRDSDRKDLRPLLPELPF